MKKADKKVEEYLRRADILGERTGFSTSKIAIAKMIQKEELDKIRGKG